MDAFKPLIAKVATGSSLTEVEAKAAFELIFAGSVAPAQLGGFLMALRARGETIAEITGAAAASGDASCRPGPGRTRHAHHFQSHRPARQSGRRQIPGAGRVCTRLARTSRAGAAQSWLQESLARAWLRRSRRGNDHRSYL